MSVPALFERATVVIARPTVARRSQAPVCGPAAGTLLSGLGMWPVRRPPVRARDDDPFRMAGVRDLRRLAALVGVGGTVWPVVASDVEMRLVDGMGAVPSGAGRQCTLSVADAIAGVVPLAPAEVWRHRVALREDTEGLV